LPQEILTKKKHGFGLPIAVWLQRDPKISQWSKDMLFDSHSLNRNYFNKSFISNLWKLQLQDDTPYYGTLVWQLLTLEAWHRVHLENEKIA
jgi:asparagine synthase (glutamine-hydrolysing)